MNDAPWVLLDTETNGLVAPIFTVELAAQRMLGWEPEGEPFRRLLNQNIDIPPQASRVNGYTREILERDGDPALEVYADFREYAGDLPLVSYNLRYDLDQVLIPEWKRLGITPIGKRGFCALELTRRLLDPVPAGNCKLQTLRQFYRLPERGAHTGLGDVQTVIDLFDEVLQPLAKQRGLDQFNDIVRFTEEPWYPRRLAFGKHKGRDFHEALNDLDFADWLRWLSESGNPRSAATGAWYLAQLQNLKGRNEPDSAPHIAVTGSGSGIVVYRNLELEKLRAWVQEARTRLAEIKAEYTQERIAVDAVQGKLFVLLRKSYQRRDRLKIYVFYREKYLDALLRGGEREAEAVQEEYRRARAQSDAEYDREEKIANESHEPSEEEATEIKALWRKLSRLFHPDRFMHDEQRRATYERLMQIINRAKDDGDLSTLREIANDPNGYLLRNGDTALDFSDSAEIAKLRSLYESLQAEILTALEELNLLHESPEYELYQMHKSSPEILTSVASNYENALAEEISQLEDRLIKVNKEINELVGQK